MATSDYLYIQFGENGKDTNVARMTNKANARLIEDCYTANVQNSTFQESKEAFLKNILVKLPVLGIVLDKDGKVTGYNKDVVITCTTRKEEWKEETKDGKKVYTLIGESVIASQFSYTLGDFFAMYNSSWKWIVKPVRGRKEGEKVTVESDDPLA